jgi:hypothetical protein
MHPKKRHERDFWERPWLLLTLVLAAGLPLLWPEVPPLLDLPGHIGRYRIQLDLDRSAALQEFYEFDWALNGNLGVDLLVQLLAPLVGLEPAVKAIVIAIPPLTVAGLFWVAHEVHGRVPPTALFAAPFAFGFPFLFGFVNFSLAMALALIAFAYWLRLARQERFRLRAALFVPISMLLWLAHVFGWGTLGVLAFSAELVRQQDNGRSVIAAAFRSAVHCLALAPPFALLLLWRSEGGGVTAGWFDLARKLEWLTMALRDRWLWFDLAALGVVAALLVAALASRPMTYSRNLAASALFLSLVFVVMPLDVFGSGYADMRLAPYLFAIAIVAVRFREGASRALQAGFAVAGLAFILIRTAGTTVSMAIEDRSFARELAALDHVPRGARLVSFVGRRCVEPWAMSRLMHLPGLAIARREAFSNDQWSTAGAQLLRVRYEAGRPFTGDPSHLVTEHRCPGRPWRTASQALATFPRHAFDYVWTIDPPPFDPIVAAGLQPIWRDGPSVLYRVTQIPIVGSARRSPAESRRRSERPATRSVLRAPSPAAR